MGRFTRKRFLPALYSCYITKHVQVVLSDDDHNNKRSNTRKKNYNELQNQQCQVFSLDPLDFFRIGLRWYTSGKKKIIWTGIKREKGKKFTFHCQVRAYPPTYSIELQTGYILAYHYHYIYAIKVVTVFFFFLCRMPETISLVSFLAKKTCSRFFLEWRWLLAYLIYRKRVLIKTWTMVKQAKVKKESNVNPHFFIHVSSWYQQSTHHSQFPLPLRKNVYVCIYICAQYFIQKSHN